MSSTFQCQTSCVKSLSIHRNFYFIFRSFKFTEIFTGDASRAKYLTVKIATQQLESTEFYMKIVNKKWGSQRFPNFSAMSNARDLVWF